MDIITKEKFPVSYVDNYIKSHYDLGFCVDNVTDKNDF